jgi:hypothetical protein
MERRNARRCKGVEFDGCYVKEIRIDEETKELIVENESLQIYRRPLVQLTEEIKN